MSLCGRSTEILRNRLKVEGAALEAQMCRAVETYLHRDICPRTHSAGLIGEELEETLLVAKSEILR